MSNMPLGFSDEEEDDFQQAKYLTFLIQNKYYAFPIAAVKEIIEVQDITAVPEVPSYCKGIINLRGEIIPVMSMRKKFELPDKENTNATRILILKLEGNSKIGILVDEVREVVTLSEDDVEKVAADVSDTRANLTGVGKYNDTLISLLNIQALITDIENDY